MRGLVEQKHPDLELASIHSVVNYAVVVVDFGNVRRESDLDASAETERH